MPGKLKTVFEFLRDYKIPDGKPANTFAFNGQLKDKSTAIKVLNDTNIEWKKIVTPKTGGPAEISA